MINVATFCFVIRNKILPSTTQEFKFPSNTFRIDIFNGATDIEIQYIFKGGDKSSPILVLANTFYSVDVLASGIVIKNISDSSYNNVQIIAWINSGEVS